MGQPIAAIDPHLDADDAVGGLGFGEAVVDVGLQRVQRYTAFAIPLAARDLDAVQAARGHDLDALRTQAHGVLHRALHRAAEHDALFELLRDAVGDQLRVDLGLAHFFDVHRHRHAQALGQFELQVLDVLALLADDHARPRRVDGDAGVLRRALDQDARHRRALQARLQELAHVQIFGQHGAEVLLRREPARRPRTCHGQPEAGRVDFLSHVFCSALALVADGHVDVTGGLADAVPRPLARADERVSVVPCST